MWPLSKHDSHLHGAAIDVESIELLGSLQGSVGLDEDDRSNATAGTILVVGEHHSLDGTCRLGKVFLCKNRGDQYFCLEVRAGVKCSRVVE